MFGAIIAISAWISFSVAVVVGLYLTRGES